MIPLPSELFSNVESLLTTLDDSGFHFEDKDKLITCRTNEYDPNVINDIFDFLNDHIWDLPHDNETIRLQVNQTLSALHYHIVLQSLKKNHHRSRFTFSILCACFFMVFFIIIGLKKGKHDEQRRIQNQN